MNNWHSTIFLPYLTMQNMQTALKGCVIHSVHTHNPSIKNQQSTHNQFVVIQNLCALCWFVLKD